MFKVEVDDKHYHAMFHGTCTLASVFFYISKREHKQGVHPFQKESSTWNFPNLHPFLTDKNSTLFLSIQ